MLQYFARSILCLLGWHPMTTSDQERWQQNKQNIVLFPHTSYWDTIFYLLNSAAFPHLFQSTYALLHSGLYDQCPRLFTHLGMLRATRAEDHHGGLVANITAQLQAKSDTFRLFLSPEGKLTATPWRTGYYHMARILGTNCHVMVAGLCYEQKRIVVVGEPQPIGDRTLDDVQQKLQQDMGQIVPLYPQHSFTPVRAHAPHNVGVCDRVLLTSHVASLSLGLGVWAVYPANLFTLALSLVTLAAGCASGYYHYANEARREALLMDAVLSVMCYVLHAGTAVYVAGFSRIYSDPIFLLLHIIVMYNFWAAIGRRSTIHRTSCYVSCHSRFHLAFGLLGLYTLYVAGTRVQVKD